MPLAPMLIPAPNPELFTPKPSRPRWRQRLRPRIPQDPFERVVWFVLVTSLTAVIAVTGVVTVAGLMLADQVFRGVSMSGQHQTVATTHSSFSVPKSWRVHASDPTELKRIDAGVRADLTTAAAFGSSFTYFTLEPGSWPGGSPTALSSLESAVLEPDSPFFSGHFAPDKRCAATGAALDEVGISQIAGRQWLRFSYECAETADDVERSGPRVHWAATVDSSGRLHVAQIDASSGARNGPVMNAILDSFTVR